MALKTQINLFLILLLLGTQIVLAQHAAVHFTGNGHAIHHDTHEHNPEDNHNHSDHEQPHRQTGEICQICFFGQALAHGAMPDDRTDVFTRYGALYAIASNQNHIRRPTSHEYLARAPPSFPV